MGHLVPDRLDAVEHPVGEGALLARVRSGAHRAPDYAAYSRKNSASAITAFELVEEDALVGCMDVGEAVVGRAEQQNLGVGNRLAEGAHERDRPAGRYDLGRLPPGGLEGDPRRLEGGPDVFAKKPLPVSTASTSSGIPNGRIPSRCSIRIACASSGSCSG